MQRGYIQKFDIGRVHKFGMERVRKFGIWARSELGIGHDVQQAFQTGGVRTWGRNRAVKTNRLVCLEQGANDLHMVQLMSLLPCHLLLQ